MEGDLQTARELAQELDIPSDGSRASQSKASHLLTLAQSSGAEFFRDTESGDYYVAPNGDGTQVWRLGSQDAARWLARLWLSDDDNPASPDTIKTALFTLGALIPESGTIPLSVRVAWQDGVLWYDLGGPAVKIGARGWQVVERPPILFKRFPHQLPQVRPAPDGDFSMIDRYLPVGPDTDEVLLLKVWLIACFSPEGPRSVLDLAGPQGSGKSTTARLLKCILDPSRVAVVRRLADFRDLQQQLAQTWALFADNLSGIGPETSDLISAAVTGDATFRRKLYTDEDAHLFAYRRVLCLNGITHTAERPDLLDRAILVTLERIRKPIAEAIFWARFDATLPQILGGAFGILSGAIALLPQVRVPRRFRMADFVRWGYAIAEAAGWGGLKFLTAYERNISRQHEEAVSASVVAQAIVEFMARGEPWEGPASKLKVELDAIAKEKLAIDPANRRSGWPQDAAGLSKEVFRLAQTLVSSGIAVSRPPRTGKRGRVILICSDSSVTADTTVTPDSKTGDGRGAGDGASAVTSRVTHFQIQSDGSDGGDGAVGTLAGCGPYG